MQLRDLSVEEIAFLSRPPQADGGFTARLAQGLAATLGARLRTVVTFVAVETQAEGTSPVPRWQVDAGLAGVWLSRRLGGRIPGGSAPFVPQGLLNTLDAVLAERWLDAPGEPPDALAWRIRVDGVEATLTLDLPQSAHDMTRWAKETVSQ